MTDDQLADAAEKTTLFARVSPAHKQRIIKALQSRKHTVGFMGDGINDAPALARRRRGDQRRHRRGHRQGIGGHDPAREVPAGPGGGRARGAQGLRQHPQVRAHGREQQLRQHVQRARGERLRAVPADGRRSRSWPTTCSTTSARPPSPPTTSTPSRSQKPRPWDIKQLTRFIVFIGPCSSIFDYTTYFMMLYVFNCWNISTPEAAAHSAEPVSDRLVRGEPADADAHHPRHPHQQDPVPAEPAVLAADGDEPWSSWRSASRCRSRRWAATSGFTRCHRCTGRSSR